VLHKEGCAVMCAIWFRLRSSVVREGETYLRVLQKL